MHAALAVRNNMNTCMCDLIIPAPTQQGAEQVGTQQRYVLLSHALASHTRHFLVAKACHRCAATAGDITHSFKYKELFLSVHSFS
jgi:hypothetical protein